VVDGVRDGVSDRPAFRMKAPVDIAIGGRRGSESSFDGAGTTGAGVVGVDIVAVPQYHLSGRACRRFIRGLTKFDRRARCR
jgi:hypothetical protein